MEEAKKRKAEEPADMGGTFKLAETPDVLKYKLDAVYRQMLDYKSETKRLQNQNDHLEQLRNLYQLRMGSIMKHIDQFSGDLKFLGSRIGLDDSNNLKLGHEKEEPYEMYSLFEKLVDKEYPDSLDDDMKRLLESTKSVVVRVLDGLERLYIQRKERTDWIKLQGNFYDEAS
jgi:hypothetical protein